MPDPWKKSYDKSRQCIKKQRHHFADKGLYSQSFGFSSSHVQMWEIYHREGWPTKNWCFSTVVPEKGLKSPSDCQGIKPVNLKGDQSWVFIGRTDVKSWLIWKHPDAGKDWGQEEKGMTEDKMVGWHHRLDGYGFGWTLGVGDGQGGLACCGSWGRRVGYDWVNWTDPKRLNELKMMYYIYMTEHVYVYMCVCYCTAEWFGNMYIIYTWLNMCICVCVSRSVVSDSLWSHGL